MNTTVLAPRPADTLSISGEMLPAAGYVRVSSLLQKDNYSPEVQREAIVKMARDHGYCIPAELWFSDVERGRHTTKREGYMRMLEACRHGEALAVFVFTTSRWGRRASESLERLEELRRRRVRFFSVQQGEQLPGVVFGIHALLDEEYVRTLARTVRPANLRAVKAGKHHGPIPFGYKRVWLAVAEGRPKTQMVPDEATAWIVTELFVRYDQGESIITLTLWLNTDPRVPPAPQGGPWHRYVVGQILRNTSYVGENTYGVRRTGYYDQTPEDDVYRGPGDQTPLVDRALFDRVQARLAERGASHSLRRVQRSSAQGVGVLLCPGCGGPLSIDRTKDPAQSLYRCSRRNNGQNDCKSRSILAAVADAAVLAEVARLQRRPWNPAVVDETLAAAAQRDPRAELKRALEAAERELQRHYRMFRLIEEPTVEEEEAFRITSREIAGRIARLKAECASVPDATLRALDLKATHDLVMRTDIPALAAQLSANGDTAGLRELLRLLLVSATITERRPAKRTRWARATVEWTPNVQTLLEMGRLALGPAPTSPEQRQACPVG